MIQHRVPARSLILAIFLFATTLLICSSSLRSKTLSHLPHTSEKKITSEYLSNVQETLDFMLGDPIPSSQFSELGRRLQTLREWISIRDDPSNAWNSRARANLTSAIERFALVDFPFIRSPKNLIDPSPLQTLRSNSVPGSRGIVIPTGKGTFRFACHLVRSLTSVLNSSLPIEIAYAGDPDLPRPYRAHLASLAPSLATTDITTRLDDTLLSLATGGWAIKPFAALASRFEQVLVLDADVVFTRPPEVLFSDADFLRTGTKFFHDRLLWQGAFKERHEWWEGELEGHELSPAIRKSRAYNDGYAEEQDSGVVVLDKGRLGVWLGLLHVCWQNSVRGREVAYRMGYGDKETWWFGMELSGVEYAFEEHYGAVVGDLVEGELKAEVKGGEKERAKKVCSFTIAHLDKGGRLSWYNGSLLRNKAVDKRVFTVPEYWMVEGVWEKGTQKTDISCMRDGKIGPITERTKAIVRRSIKLAKEVDEDIQNLVDWD
ncbi:MAG: hypothetical protein MMC23_005574 [Stictis urceolatum]|nr:hypothetical protein [Stictis urceolata]